MDSPYWGCCRVSHTNVICKHKRLSPYRIENIFPNGKKSDTYLIVLPFGQIIDYFLDYSLSGKYSFIMEETRIISAEDVGKIIRARRKELGYTQADFAKAVGTGVRFISDLENGKPTVQFDKTIHVLSMAAINLYAKER